MTLRAITNVRLVLPGRARDGGLLFDGERIVEALWPHQPPPPDARLSDGRGRYLAPGFFDVHVHGGGGFDLMTADADQVRLYARWIVSRGVTSFLVSTAGRDHAQILARLRALAPLAGAPGAAAARMAGFHLEGPYINPGRRGAFDPRWLRPPAVGEYEQLLEAAAGALRQITLAPELPGAGELIRAVVRSRVIAAMGHTDATYAEAVRAVALGVSHVTHCFNAMRAFSHRDPGVLGAVMTSDALTAELIGDGAHVDFAAARVLVRALGSARVVLVTDGMPLAGTADGEGVWEGTPIRVEGGKAVRVADGTIIGGVITLDQTVRNAVEHLGVSLPAAAAMASTNPARAMQLADRGVLAPGALADFVLLDDDLRVTETWVAGERVYAS